MRMFVVMLAWLVLGAVGCADRADGGGAGAPAPVVVFAAASLGDVIGDIAAGFESAHGAPVRVNLAASSTLARQVEAGARADVFVSANLRWMDYLEQRELIVPGTRFELAGNALVVVAPRRDGAATPEPAPELHGELDPDLALPGRIAIADPEHVPAGLYASQTLENLGWLERLRPRLVATVDVRAALRLAELGEADAAIVYETDARASDRVRATARVPGPLHEAIVYPAAACRGGDAVRARRFLDHLRGPAARQVLREAGFRVPAEGS